MRQYLYIDQLAEVTPWSASAIRTMMARGEFTLGVHFFKPGGPHSRPIFSWAAVKDYIKGTAPVDATGGEAIRLANGNVVDVNEAAQHMPRLCGRAAQ